MTAFLLAAQSVDRPAVAAVGLFVALPFVIRMKMRGQL